MFPLCQSAALSTTGTKCTIWQYIHVHLLGELSLTFTSHPFSQLVLEKNIDSWMRMGETEDISEDTGINTAF